MTSTEKVNNVVFVVENELDAKHCSCGSIYFLQRPHLRDTFSATYVDCIKCGEPYRIGGIAWPVE